MHPLEVTSGSIVADTTDNFPQFGESNAHLLSPQARGIWAKSGGTQQWLPLWRHMRDSQLMARYLLDHYVAPSVIARWEETFGDHVDARVVAEFLAGAHDIGKGSCVFVAQHEPLAEQVRALGLPCPPMSELRDDRKVLPHSRVSQAVLGDWLQGRGVEKQQATALSSVVGNHHGRPQAPGRARTQCRRRPLALGGEQWSKVRVELLDWLSALTGFDGLVLHLHSSAIPITTVIEMAGFTVVADWLASNTRYFPLADFNDRDTTQLGDISRATHAWEEIAMPNAWAPEQPTQDAQEYFRDAFDWPSGRKPRPLQHMAFQLAQECPVGMMFIEASTGGGKTETALAAAHVIAAQQRAQGLLIALPTQATTDAMFYRVDRWVEHLPEPPDDYPAWAITLAHGKSLLNPRFASMTEQIQRFDAEDIGPQYDGTAGTGSGADEYLTTNAVAHQWFASSKRRLLSNFAVVTIDQLLVAALQRKHLALAHFALSGKVVIIDEAHASDTFMNVYLDAILNWLGAYHVPVIVLSATLTDQRRKEMLAAYAPVRATEIQSLTSTDEDYPLLTVLPADNSAILQRTVPDDGRRIEITFAWTAPDNLVDEVVEAWQTGACVLVVRNTVTDAQETANALKAAGIESVTLNHARFLAVDRARNDASLVSRFGPPDTAERPPRAVVVATQVVEQSLDVDFDVLYTDIAPIDLLIQRIGRMHRHERPRPASHTHPVLHLIGIPGNEDNLPEISEGSIAVYREHTLFRTAAALLEHGNSLVIPDDVAPLVDLVASEQLVGPASWQEKLAEANQAEKELLDNQRRRASTWVLEPYETFAEEPADLSRWTPIALEPSEDDLERAVRDIEETLEVLVVPLTPDGSAAIRPPWLQLLEGAPEVLDTSIMPSSELAREIASWSIRLPRSVSRWAGAVINAIDSLPSTRRWEWRRHPLLKGQLLLPMNITEEGKYEMQTTLELDATVLQLWYTPIRGLEVRFDELQSR